MCTTYTVREASAAGAARRPGDLAVGPREPELTARRPRGGRRRRDTPGEAAGVGGRKTVTPCLSTSRRWQCFVPICKSCPGLGKGHLPVTWRKVALEPSKPDKQARAQRGENAPPSPLGAFLGPALRLCGVPPEGTLW